MDERENFYRFGVLLLDVGTRVLREAFTFHHLGSTPLAAYLSSNKSCLQKLSFKILSQEQRNILFPQSGKNAVIEEFDITLLCVLFRNLDPKKPSNDSVWSSPSITDHSFQADVTRIRVIRNNLFAHLPSASLDNSTFTTETRELTTIYHRMITTIPSSQISPTDLNTLIEKELKGPLQPELENEIKKLKVKLEEWKRNDEQPLLVIYKRLNDVENRQRDIQAKLKRGFKNVKKDSTRRRKKTNAAIAESRKTGRILRGEIDTIKGRVDTLEEEYVDGKRQWDSLKKEEKIFIDKKEQQRIIALSQSILEQHRTHAEKNFVDTQGYRDANEILQQYRKLIITGKSGQGKSYMAYHLLNKVIEVDSDIKPLILSTVKQWKTLVDPSTNLGIIVDDMCGKFVLNEGELMKWREECTYMPTVIENGRHVVIFTMKSFFYEKILTAMQAPSLFSTQIVLSLDNISLKFEEKNEFALTYLKKFCLSDAELSDICKIQEAPVGFPQLCRAAEMIKEKPRLFNLFSKPSKMIQEQIKHIRLNDTMTYGCLGLVLLSGGKLNQQSIRDFRDESEKKENRVISVLRSYGLLDTKAIKIQDELNSLKGTYLSFDSTDKSYSFAHDSTEEAVFISYGEFVFKETLLYCSLQLICKHCTMKDDSKALKIASKETTLILVNRFITALKGGNPTDFTIVSEAKVWSCEAFRKTFFAESKEVHVLADKDENSLMVHAANADNRDLVHALVHELDNIPEDQKRNVAQFLTKSAKASCAHENTYLLEKICKKGHVDVNDILPIAIQHGSVQAIDFLLQSGADVNYRSKNGENLIHIACTHSRLDIVKLLHSKNASLLNELDHYNRSLGLCVVSGGNVEIMEYLVPFGLNPCYADSTGWNLLHYACLQAKKPMVEHLLQKYPKLLSSEIKEGISVLKCAAFGGNLYIFKQIYELLKDSLKNNQSANENRTIDITYLMLNAIGKQTLLHMSCLGGGLEITKYLVETYPSMLNEMDSNERTPAHLAAEGGNVAVLMYLIDRGTDPWCKTSSKETLLHRACLKGQLEMTKYLGDTYPKLLSEVDNSKRTPAHHAVESGNVAVLKYLIDRGTNPRCKNSDDETLLHRACIRGQLEMSKYLVELYPAMLHDVDNCMNTPAHHAAESGNVDLLTYLTVRGADPWCRSNENETLLHSACINGQLEMTKYLIETYPQMLCEVDDSKNTPAHHAAESGCVAVLSYLIERGTDPWCRTSEEETLLHSACINGQLEMTKYLVETYPAMLFEVDDNKSTPAHHAAESDSVSVLSYLIDQGIDPYCRTSEEDTLLHKACINGHLEMTKYLIDTYPTLLSEVDNNKSTPAHNAAESGTVLVLRYLTDRGTDPWCRTSEKETLLHRACINGQLEMTKYLVVTYPKMLNEVDSSNRTPAHCAAESGEVSVLRYLIDCGIDPWCINSEDETLLHRACKKGQLHMTKYLVETYPTMLSTVDKRKRTPAHHAADSGDVSVLTYLINRGIDPWCINSEDETLLHRACKKGQLHMTKYLVETYPTMLHQVDKRKRTPAHPAAESGEVSVLSYLINRGIDPWCINSEDETLLHRACKKGQLHMTKYLVETYPMMLSTVDERKRTPAHHAAESGEVSVLAYLINRGIDPWCINSEDETLLHRACKKGQLHMTKYLVETYPTMLHQVDKRKRTPAHHASEGGDISVLNFIVTRGGDPCLEPPFKKTRCSTEDALGVSQK